MISQVFIALGLTDLLVLGLLVSLGRAWWSVKTAAVIAAAVVNFTVIHAAVTGTGWPTSGLPANAVFVACAVVEPGPNEPGAVYFWLIPDVRGHALLGFLPRSTEPRAYAEPYDRNLHRACLAARKAQLGGNGVGIHGRSGHRTVARPYLLPRPVIPSKESS